jgi:hypothetical protein
LFSVLRDSKSHSIGHCHERIPSQEKYSSIIVHAMVEAGLIKFEVIKSSIREESRLDC